jgi:calpain-7
MSSRQEREFGLEGQHSYVILDMKETEDEKAFLVKNPWVEGKGWRGPRPLVAERDATPSTGSRNATGDSHRNSILSQETSTKFWIGLDHIVQHFESLYLNWNPGLFRHRQDIHFEWAISAAEVAGRCIVTHPQFCFWTKDSGVVWLLLSRHFRDSVFDNKDESDNFNNGSVRSETHMYSSSEPLKGYMSLYVCNGKGERLYVKESYLECGPFVNTPQTLLRWDTDANSTYTIVVDQEDLPASTYTFSLSAFSNSMMSLEPAVEKYAHQEIISGAWTKHTAGGGVGSPYYFDNPQYSLEVSENSSLALLLTSTTHTHPMHVKLAIGHGKRVYRLQSRDVIVDSGDHSGQCVFAETAKLQRGTYTVICSLFDQGRTGDYSLRVDSTGPVVLKPIPREGAGLFLNKLTPACFAAHVHKIAAPIMPNRLASYTIVARFKNATTPRSHNNLGMLARSPLRLSVEMGRGPERLFLNTSERGEYADSTVVRTDSFDIDPLLKMQGDLWIVLDRLSGTGGPVEEWYDVEILTDVPQAYAVGVWREWDD